MSPELWVGSGYAPCIFREGGLEFEGPGDSWVTVPTVTYTVLQSLNPRTTLSPLPVPSSSFCEDTSLGTPRTQAPSGFLLSLHNYMCGPYY